MDCANAISFGSGRFLRVLFPLFNPHDLKVILVQPRGNSVPKALNEDLSYEYDQVDQQGTVQMGLPYVIRQVATLRGCNLVGAFALCDPGGREAVMSLAKGLRHLVCDILSARSRRRKLFLLD